MHKIRLNKKTYSIECQCGGKVGNLITIKEAVILSQPCNDCPDGQTPTIDESAVTTMRESFEAVLKCKDCESPIIIDCKDKLIVKEAED